MAAHSEDTIAPLGERGDARLSDTNTPLSGGTEHELEDRSLFEDVENLIEDGKTYLQAEVAFQKTRAAFAGNRVKLALLFAVVGGALGFLALIGLTVGLIMALAPYLTIWGSSALVVGLLLLGTFLCLRAAAGKWGEIMSAFDSSAATGQEEAR